MATDPKGKDGSNESLGETQDLANTLAAERLKELDAIAACVIGGASLMGGRGTVFGACLGALIMASLDNGMSLLNVRDFMQDIIKGSILVVAVGLDMVGRRGT